MRAAAFAGALVLAAWGTAAAEPVGKPYAPVSAAYDRGGAQDPAFLTFLAGLRSAVQAKRIRPIERALARGFVALNCAASPLAPCAPGKAPELGRRIGEPLQRMRLAFCCGGAAAPDVSTAAQDDTLFATADSALGAGAPGANPDAPGEICAPALPRLDRAKVAAAAQAAGVEPENLRVATADLPLREQPAGDRKGVLSAGSIAPIVTDLTRETPAGWTAIALPDGSIGYTDHLGLDEIAPAALCFGRIDGRWRIVAAILRGG